MALGYLMSLAGLRWTIKSPARGLTGRGVSLRRNQAGAASL
ncbi:Unknown protein sequence [Pseudomonas coronafaciens pv. oryzae]|nr:Unknown protein sequence [Pseudomonas coronafaciens pv. oryzae]